MIVPNHAPIPITAKPLLSMNASLNIPICIKMVAPDNQVARAAQRNHNKAVGAIYLLIDAAPGPPPSTSDNAVATPGT